MRVPTAEFFAAVVALVLMLAGGPARGAPDEGPVLAVLGGGAGGAGDLEAAAAGARVAWGSAGGNASVEVLDDGATKAGLDEALRRARARKAVGVLALPSATLEAAYLDATRSLKVPWFFLSSIAPDVTRSSAAVRHLAPSPAAQAIVAADSLLAPLGARSVAVVHEPTERGKALFAGFVRNLSPRVPLVGSLEWPAAGGREAFEALKPMEAHWIYVAFTGARARSFVEAAREATWVPRCLFADGCRSDRLLAVSPKALAESAFLDGPDPELTGRDGTRLFDALERAGVPLDAPAARGFEGARRLLAAIEKAGSSKAAKLEEALAAPDASGVLGPLVFEPHGGARFFPFTVWHVKAGRLQPWPRGHLPEPGCGPPLGFGLAPPAEIGARGKVGYLTFGEGEKRTIESDMLGIGLSTAGVDESMDEFCRGEILARAIRIAHRLFRREADGTPIPGWSWGMTFTTKAPSPDQPRNRTWLGIVAGDHPDAGGQVIGSGMAAIYSTFLKRTMYASRKLDPPLGPEDRPLLDGTYRWAPEGVSNLRVDHIRCLLDGFASAVGLTLAHEFGHLCGCGHDTEAPTSIMNVVAGAGASWEEAVWIPSHQKSLTTTLGIDGVR